MLKDLLLATPLSPLTLSPSSALSSFPIFSLKMQFISSLDSKLIDRVRFFILLYDGTSKGKALLLARDHSLTAESRDAYSVYSMPSADFRRPVEIDTLFLFLGIDVLNEMPFPFQKNPQRSRRLSLGKKKCLLTVLRPKSA